MTTGLEGQLRFRQVYARLRQEDYDYDLPGPAATDDIAAVKAYFGDKLPEAWLAWMTQHDGAPLPSGNVYSCAEVLEAFRLAPVDPDQADLWRDNRWLPVLADGCGNAWFIDCTEGPTGGRVFYVDNSAPSEVDDWEEGDFLQVAAAQLEDYLEE